MNGYNFTDRVRKVLQMAREEAARLHHEYVGTEHILLGLIREGEGVAAAVLQKLNVDLEEIQQKSLPSQDDEIEEKKIKLHKLALKDRMEELLRAHRETRVSA